MRAARPAAAKSPAVSRLKPIVLRVARRYGVNNIRIFGSFARGEQRKTSDIDLLVDLPEGMTILDLSALKIDLEEALMRKVDVVPAPSVKPALRDRIFA